MMDQQKAIKLEQPTRNWLDLPSELTANILYRIGVVDILLNAQNVCTAWREICKDPAMWRVVYMDTSSDTNADLPLDDMCKHAVYRSQGQLVDFTIVEFGDYDIVKYIANRCSQLKRLTIACRDDYMEFILTKSLNKFPLLEELNLYATDISKEGIETAGCCCPMLKTLKVNQEDYGCWNNDCRFWDEWYWGWPTMEGKQLIDDDIAKAIGQHLPELRHLELIGSTMSNEGLEMILDGCHHLESLDLRGCLDINLDGALGRRCSQQIQSLKLPYDSVEGCPFIYQMP